MDLVNVGPDVAKEKDDLLEKVRIGCVALPYLHGVKKGAQLYSVSHG